MTTNRDKLNAMCNAELALRLDCFSCIHHNETDVGPFCKANLSYRSLHGPLCYDGIVQWLESEVDE